MHHPKAVVALLVYAYCIGMRSSRQIERPATSTIADSLPVVRARLFPDHTTTARFRSGHEQVLESLFFASLRLCHPTETGSVGLVAPDTTLIAAPASMQ